MASRSNSNSALNAVVEFAAAVLNSALVAVVATYGTPPIALLAVQSSA